MLLYSKRYKKRLFSVNRRFLNNDEERRVINRFLNDSLRNRLIHEIKYVIESGNYVEKFITVHDEASEKYILHKNTLSDLTNREVGYDIADIFDPRLLKFNIESDDYDDSKLFDLLEIILIFSLPEKREILKSRFENILNEESKDYKIHSFMVIKSNDSGLKSIAPLIRERNLKEKIEEYYKNRIISDDHQTLAQISAEILQLLFSSPDQKDKTKEYSENLCEEIANKWVAKNKVPELKILISESVKNAKGWNNQITNIRHTDRTTVPIESPSVYRLISSRNISIVEMVVLSLPEKYVLDTDPDVLKDSYFEKYKVNSRGWIIEKPKESEINIDDIPF